MLLYALIFLSIFNSVMSKPSYFEFDEDDNELLKAAYETPSYHDDCDDEDLKPGKVDLVQDSLWAFKAKIQELKAFNKALAANLISTKLKLKQLIINSVNEKKEKLEALKKDKKIKYQLHEPVYSQYPPIPIGYDPYIGI